MTFKDLYFYHHIEFENAGGATSWLTVKGHVVEAVSVRQWMVKYDGSPAMQMVSLREMISRTKPEFRWKFFVDKYERDQEYDKHALGHYGGIEVEA